MELVSSCFKVFSDVVQLYCIAVGSRRLMSANALQLKAYCTKPGLYSFLIPPPGVITRDPSSERGNYLGEKMADEFCLKMPDFHVTFRDILHAVNLRHGTNSFTSFPKEGVLRIFFALKNPTASARFEPTNLGTKGQHATSRPPKPLDVVLYLCSV